MHEVRAFQDWGCSTGASVAAGSTVVCDVSSECDWVGERAEGDLAGPDAASRVEEQPMNVVSARLGDEIPRRE
jgi:hypothetical protein